ncbi:hypothetical protein BJ138DRAFT_1149436 [Hygrophoropsis aurantiaca]|uniref:Uncharacterized protein n=1 Tax=Hygrophoropsis aurantiaca TaxID=72124 RepID=A0ACB8AGT8_9AGAM|nr:hypothetical protein BJ138DRAFT_1149436 [Hygrophoropsis aurantiaca]
MRHLFVGVDDRKYMVAGRYEFKCVDPLSAAEWAGISEEIRRGYCKTTKRKNKDPQSIAQIHHAYDTGKLKVPCVLLSCLDFNEKFHLELKAKKDITLSSSNKLGHHSRKREREESHNTEGTQVNHKARIS